MTSSNKLQTGERAENLLSAERLIGLRRLEELCISPCGTWAALAVKRLSDDPEKSEYVSDLWRIPLEGEGSPFPLTRGACSDSAPCFRRDGALGFLSDRPTEEGLEKAAKRKQLWLLRAEGGEPFPLTDEPLGVLDFQFAKKANRLLMTTPFLPKVPLEDQREAMKTRADKGPSVLHYTQMPVRFWDHWLSPAWPHLIACDEEGGNREDLTPDAIREHHLVDWKLSDDGDHVVIGHSVTGSERLPQVSWLHIQLSTKARNRLGELPNCTFSNPLFSPDGQRFACISERYSVEAISQKQIWIFALDTGDGAAISEGWDRGPSIHAWSADGSSLLCTAADQGREPVFNFVIETESVERWSSSAAGGSHFQLDFLPAGDEVIGLRHTFFHPPEVFRMPARTESTPALISALSGFAPHEGQELATWRDFTVEGKDGVPVQSFLMEPTGQKESGPAMLWIHGGPIGQYADAWHWRWNALLFAAQGYTMVLANPRGSTGQGTEFVNGIWGKPLGRCLL